MALTVTSIIITSVICTGILYIMLWHFRRRRFYKLATKFEGPPVLPFIGNALLFVGNSEQLLTTINELTSSYTSPSRMWLGPMLICFITEPEQIETICLSPKTLNRGKVFVDCAFPWVGNGLFTAPASIWKVHRKLIQPTFNTEILNSFVEIFSVQSKILVDKIEKNLDGPEFEIFDLVSMCTLDMICETTMGVKIEAQTNKYCHYEDAAHTVIAGMCKRIFSVWLHPDLTFRLSKLGRVQRKCIKYLKEFADNVIKEKKSQLLERNSEPDTVDDAVDSTPRRRKAFLDHLMELSESSSIFSDEELREETDTMVVAGNDSTVVSNIHLLSMLASHPDVQEKVYRELYEIYGNDDVEVRPVTHRDLPRMKYLERVIKETLRLFPVIPFTVREVTDDLDIGDHTLPRGSTAAIAIFTVQRSEKYWPDPLKFDPDRFLPEEIAKRHPYAFVPFSGGPRNCIGLNYAMMSMKTLAATILRKYILIKDDIVPVKDIRLKMEIVLSPADPIKMRIERRNEK